jgi:large-conductance mechanosensitive channel
LDLKVKIILSFLLLVSLILFEYYPIKALQQSSNLSNQYGIPTDTTSLWLEIFAMLILCFVVFCVIWAIPETTTRKRTEKKEVGFETDKASTQPFKEKNVDEMIENGYVLNVETGKWEKQQFKPREREKMPYE